MLGSGRETHIHAHIYKIYQGSSVNLERLFPVAILLAVRISLGTLQVQRAAEVPGSIVVSKSWLCTYAKLEIGWQKPFPDPRLAGIPHERTGQARGTPSAAGSAAARSLLHAKTCF